jgi:DNA-binding response OmpR family regulator
VTDEIPTNETRDTASVLIVEDETDLADMYARYLDDYDVEVAYSGQQALDVLGDGFDVVLLDRRMPVVSGNEVLGYVEDEGLNVRVAMVTAVDPDFEIIDLRIDDYLVKPVTRAEARDTVDRLLKLDEYDQRLRMLTSKKIKRNVLQVEKTGHALEESAEFQQLNEEIAELESEVEAIARELDVESIDT